MKKVLVGLIAVAAIAAWLLWSHHATSSETSAVTNGSGSVVARTERAKAAVPASVSGRVTNKASGAGIANAVVALSSGGAFGGELGIGAPMVTAVTDATGAWTAPSVAPSDYIITATAAGFLPAQTPKLSIGSGEQRKDIALALAPGGTLVKGTVTDIGGGPIEGAKIALIGEERFDWNSASYVVLTGHDGTYQVSLADGNYAIAAKHDDYVPKSQSVSVAGKPVTADFVLTPGGGVRGVVVARDTGKPLPFALVHAVPAHGRFDGGGEPVTADADGKFAVHSLRSGVIAISAFGRGYASVAPTTVEVGIGEQVDNIRVVVDRAYTISGIVVKKGTQTGIAGIHLGAFSLTQGAQVNAVDPSDNQGRFAIDGVRPGSFMLYAMGEHQVPNIGKQVQIVDKDINDVVLEIETGVTVTGKVAPPQEATIGLQLAGAIGIANMFEAVKTMMVHGDADPTTGEFKLTNVPSGAFKLVATSKAGPVGTLPVAIADADVKDLVVTMEPRAAVSGKVVDTTGASIADARITTHRTDDSKDNSDNNIQINGGPAQHKSLPDGTFHLVGLDAGTYELDAVVNDEFDFGDKKKKKVSVTLAAGEDKTGVTLVVEAHNGVIRGQVIGSDKQPAPDSWVTAKRITKASSDATPNEDWWPTSEPVLTGADGKFTIAKLRDGDYDVVAEGPHGGSRAEKTPVRPGDNVTIELAPLGTLTGHVTSNGSPVTSYSITCRGPGTAERTIAAADGAYSIEHMAPGKYACTASCDAGTATGSVDVPTSAATLDLKLTAWASVTGIVINMFDRKPVVGLLAIAGMEDNDAGMADVIAGNGPKTDATGRFIVPRVPVGTGQLLIMDGTGGFKPLATKPYTVTDGQRVDVGTIEIVPPRQGDAGTLGMVTEPDVESEKDLAKAKALTVTQVKPDGPAAAAGIVVGDVITTIDGRNVSDLGAVQSMNYLSSGTIGIGITVAVGLDKKGTVNVTSVKW